MSSSYIVFYIHYRDVKIQLSQRTPVAHEGREAGGR